MESRLPQGAGHLAVLEQAPGPVAEDPVGRQQADQSKSEPLVGLPVKVAPPILGAVIKPPS